jgi:hypothetical protein
VAALELNRVRVLLELIACLFEVEAGAVVVAMNRPVASRVARSASVVFCRLAVHDEDAEALLCLQASAHQKGKGKEFEDCLHLPM